MEIFPKKNTECKPTVMQYCKWCYTLFNVHVTTVESNFPCPYKSFYFEGKFDRDPCVVRVLPFNLTCLWSLIQQTLVCLSHPTSLSPLIDGVQSPAAGP